MLDLAQSVRNARKKAALSQSDLASLTGVSRNYIAQIEISRKRPSLELLSKIAIATNTPVGSFVEGDPFFADLKRQFRERALEIKRELPDSE